MVATRLAVAVHILLLLACGRSGALATSAVLAGSINTNPVVVRRITRMLARAGLIEVRRGPGGAVLVRPAETISLGDVWRAVNPGPSRPLLPLHAGPNQGCPVGREVHAVLGHAFAAAEDAMHAALCGTSLAGLVEGMRREAA